MSFNFQQALVAFNRMYGLPVNETPTLLGSKRLKDLKQILLDEVNEIDVIINKMELHEVAVSNGTYSANEAEASAMEILTDMADLMGDIQVYCGSEMTKWGLPNDATLRIIMESNMSKLGADGLPIVDGNGKVQKGPNYWKPEPMLMQLLKQIVSGNILEADRLAQLMVHKHTAATEKQA